MPPCRAAAAASVTDLNAAVSQALSLPPVWPWVDTKTLAGPIAAWAPAVADADVAAPATPAWVAMAPSDMAPSATAHSSAGRMSA